MPKPTIELAPKDVTDEQARDLSEAKIDELLGQQPTPPEDAAGKKETPAAKPAEEKPTAEEAQAQREAEVQAALALTKEIEDRATKEGKTVDETRAVVEKERADKATAEEQDRIAAEAAQVELEKQIKERAEKEGKTEDEVRAAVEKEQGDARAKQELDNKVFAGKLKGPEALVTGVIEKVKELGYKEKAFQIALDIAKKSGDYAPIEEMYKELDSETTARAQAAEAEAKRQEEIRTAALEAELPAETEAEQEQRISQVVRATFDEIDRSQLGEEFRAAGVELPHTKDELEAVWEKSARLGFKFEEAYQRTYQLLDKAVGEHRKASLRLKDVEASVKSGEQKKIMEFANKHGLDTVKEDDVKALIDQVYKETANTESRSGVAYPIAGRAYQRFLVEHLDTAIDKRVAKAQMDGRVQHEKDLEDMSRRTIKTISTAPIPAARRTEKKAVDVTDRDAVAGMTDEEIDKGLLFGPNK